MVNWQNQLWDTFHTTPRGQSCELLGTYLSWMSESRSWRLARKIPPYERLAQDTQCKIELLRLIRGEIQRVYVSHKVKLWISDCVCILGKLNASSHWSNLEVWRRCVHNHGYWNELFQPSRWNTLGEKIATRVFASTASNGLTFNADILQKHHIDKHFYLWNVIYWLHHRKLIKYSQLFTKY